jgi:hypothetical protein
MREHLAVVLAIGTLAGIAGTAAASNGPLLVSFEKHWVGPGHYTGTACGDGTIDMQLSDSSVTGNVQHFAATVRLACTAGSLTAAVEGGFNASTGKTVLNGRVVDGWLRGAQVHEEGQLVGVDPFTFVGTVQLMPGSAD